MPKLRSAAPSLLLGTTQAGGNLTLAATAWMVSGLTPSPLLNSLLPALGALPLLLQLKRHPKGYGLQLLAVVLLIAISLSIGPKTASQTWPLLGCYAAVVLFGFGREVSTLPIERRLLSSSNTTMQRLRRGQDMGTLVGNLLAALLFPAIRQFLPALLLLLPMTGVAARGEQSPEPVPSPLPQRLPFDPRCMLQGLVLGGLFALLALWVRQVDGGKCYFILSECKLGGKNKEIYILGAAFLKHFYSAFDFDKNTVSLGLNTHSSGGVKIITDGAKSE